MEREYSSGSSSKARYFVGKEVEHTPAYGLKTLFVVGTHSPIRIVNSAIDEQCEHIYLGANMSFNGTMLQTWQDMIQHALNNEFWVTVDFDITHWTNFRHTFFKQFLDNNKFIPMISVKLPDLTMLGSNATIKIDDIDFNKTNEGVWCINKHKLIDNAEFTDWAQYKDDTIINPEEST